MNYKWAVILYLHIASIHSAPSNQQTQTYDVPPLPVALPQMPDGLPQGPVNLPPIPVGLPQMPVGMSQLYRSPFMRQMLPVQSPMMYPQPQQPMIIFLPNGPNAIPDDRYTKLNEHDLKDQKPNTGHIDASKEAIVVEAEPNNPLSQPKNAIVYLPNEGRYSIGTIISYIPFLPIEVNVPDTISTIGNWISGIFSRPSSGSKLGSLNRFSPGSVPLLVVPYPGAMPQF